jgi:hypothetical protein
MQRAKNANTQPTHPAEGILFNFKQQVNNYLNPYEQTLTFPICLSFYPVKGFFVMVNYLNYDKTLRNRFI